MSAIGSPVRRLDLVIGNAVLIETAETLKSAWDLPETLNTEALAFLVSQHLEQWLEDFCEHPDFFLKENAKFRRAVAALAQASEPEIPFLAA